MAALYSELGISKNLIIKIIKISVGFCRGKYPLTNNCLTLINLIDNNTIRFPFSH